MTSEGHEDNGHAAESSDTSLSTLRYQQMMRMRSLTPIQEERITQSQQEELLAYDELTSSHISATPISPGGLARSQTMSSTQLRFKSAPEPIHNVMSQIEVNLEELWRSFIRVDGQESFDEHGALLFSGLRMRSVVEAESIEGRVKAVVGMWMERWHSSTEIEWHSLGSLIKGKGKARRT